MEYTEYMETLKEQIQNKRARSLVAEEIRGHIEEQAKEYQAEGMSKEDAEREAVRQMGDPVETGCALNRIHRPAFPWKLFVLAVFLTGASMLISLTIDAKINEDGVQAAQVGSLFMVNAVSFAMIFVIMYFDYMAVLHIRAVYAVYDLPVSGVVGRHPWKLSDSAAGKLQCTGAAASDLCGNYLSVPGTGISGNFKISRLDHYPVYGINSRAHFTAEE